MESVSQTRGVQAILAAATRLFAKSGYEAVSVASIAELAKVSKANVFHHFDSKHALYVEVIRGACGRHALFAEKLLSEAGPAAEKICRLMIFELEDMLFFAEQESRLVVGEFMSGCAPRGGPISAEVINRKIVVVADLIRQGQDTGEFRRDVDPGLAAVLIDAAMIFFFKARETLGTCAQFHYANDPALYARESCRLLLHGICAPAP
jgi:TetR/AcrR family transcriptional regulator